MFAEFSYYFDKDKLIAMQITLCRSLAFKIYEFTCHKKRSSADCSMLFVESKIQTKYLQYPRRILMPW